MLYSYIYIYYYIMNLEDKSSVYGYWSFVFTFGEAETVSKESTEGVL